ncbi:IS6 family transposase domain protein (plasmid) [Candidatus Trichorickettsia mobilis]|nr:IS6 family transposase domain protein [Candidatus Trichorickettsia mobilis]
MLKTTSLTPEVKELVKDMQIELRQVKYLNNIVEQDHRFIKKRTKPMLGFNSFRSAKITISGIENIRIIQKGQLIGSNNNLSTFENFKTDLVLVFRTLDHAIYNKFCSNNTDIL